MATLLWSRTGEERARHNLRQTLSKLRRLCPDLIECPGDRIALNAEVCLVDARKFDELARLGDLRNLDLALKLYRGDLLEGYSAREPEYQDWLEAARGRLRKQAVGVADRLAGLLREQGRDREAIEVLNHLLRIDMANESAHRNLMVLLAREGRRSDALRQYQDCVAALARELDAEPGAETKGVLDEIQKGPSRPPGETWRPLPSRPSRQLHPHPGRRRTALQPFSMPRVFTARQSAKVLRASCETTSSKPSAG